MPEPRVLIWDIETAPILGYVWKKWDTNLVGRPVEDWTLLTISWKWLGEKRAYVKGLDDFVTQWPDDEPLAALAADLFNEADIVVAHNGIDFDTKKAMARIAYWGLEPPRPFLEVDTLKVARKKFAFTSNSLDDLCHHLGLGVKGKPGWEVWEGCMKDDPAAWRKMKRYCRNDVLLLEQLYLRLLPFMDRHPNMALIGDRPDACPKCGKVGDMIVRGYRYNQVTKRVKYQCGTCHAYCAGRAMLKSEVKYVI